MIDLMTPPPEAEISPSGPVWLNEDGIVVTITTTATQDLTSAKENVAFQRKVAAGKPRPLLVDMTSVRSISKEAREEYVKEREGPFITAVALVTKSSIARMVGNFFIGLNHTHVPAKLFSDPAKARDWLLQYRVD